MLNCSFLFFSDSLNFLNIFLIRNHYKLIFSICLNKSSSSTIIRSFIISSFNSKISVIVKMSHLELLSSTSLVLGGHFVLMKFGTYCHKGPRWYRWWLNKHFIRFKIIILCDLWMNSFKLIFGHLLWNSIHCWDCISKSTDIFTLFKNWWCWLDYLIPHFIIDI